MVTDLSRGGIAVRCPVCDAAEGEPCRVRRTGLPTEEHRMRFRVWKRMWEEARGEKW